MALSKILLVLLAILPRAEGNKPRVKREELLTLSVPILPQLPLPLPSSQRRSKYVAVAFFIEYGKLTRTINRLNPIRAIPLLPGPLRNEARFRGRPRALFRAFFAQINLHRPTLCARVGICLWGGGT